MSEITITLTPLVGGLIGIILTGSLFAIRAVWKQQQKNADDITELKRHGDANVMNTLKEVAALRLEFAEVPKLIIDEISKMMAIIETNFEKQLTNYVKIADCNLKHGEKK